MRTCVACGTLFSNLPRRDWYSACSVECDRRRHRARKKAQKIKREDAEKDHKRRIKVVDPIKVFERDGWRCRLCGVPTPLELRNKNLPNSPELDHVVPLSRQGEHSYENTQLLCRRCNLDKADLLLHEM